MTVFSRSCYDLDNLDVPCCKSFHFFDIHVKSCWFVITYSLIQMHFDNESSATASRRPTWRPYNVINYDNIVDRENVYVNNSSKNRVWDVGEASFCLFRHGASTDLQHDLSGLFIRSGHLTWSKVRFSNWPFGDMDMFRRVSTRLIRWCFAFFSIFLTLNVIYKNVDRTKMLHFLFEMLWNRQNVK